MAYQSILLKCNHKKHLRTSFMKQKLVGKFLPTDPNFFLHVSGNTTIFFLGLTCIPLHFGNSFHSREWRGSNETPTGTKGQKSGVSKIRPLISSQLTPFQTLIAETSFPEEMCFVLLILNIIFSARLWSVFFFFFFFFFFFASTINLINRTQTNNIMINKSSQIDFEGCLYMRRVSKYQLSLVHILFCKTGVFFYGT